MVLHYSFAEVPFRHKTIRYLKTGKGTGYAQFLDIRRAIQQASPELIVVIMHGVHHISGGSTQADEELLMEYFQSSDFVAERLVWTKGTQVVANGL